MTSAIRMATVMVITALGMSTPAHADQGNAGNPTIGQKLFIQCRACHTVAAGGGHSIGPNLNGVFGAKAGSRPGYVYSPAMTKAGVTWDARTLDRFLTRPSSMIPGTKMAFAGVAAQKARADIVAYLATLKAPRR